MNLYGCRKRWLRIHYASTFLVLLWVSKVDKVMRLLKKQQRKNDVSFLFLTDLKKGGGSIFGCMFLLQILLC